jgi:Rrf2 family protein
MKLTTRTRYGVRGVFDIAYHAGDLPTQMKYISERQRISPPYLDQIFTKLKRAGILGAKRGPKGGYFLLKEPKDITVYDILECTDGPIELVYCVSDNADGQSCSAPVCDMKGQCAASPMWKELGDEIADVFRRITIQDLCNRAHAMGIERQLDVRVMNYT